MKNDRRTFLKSLVALGVAAPSAALASQNRQTAWNGLVLATERHLELATRLTSILNAQSTKQICYSLQTTPNNAMQTLATAQSAFKLKRPDLILAFGDGMAQTLEPLASEYGLPIIAAEYGVRMNATHSPYVFSESLEVWQASWALGSWSAQNLGANTVVVTSSLESGYDLPHAFASGLAASGGKVDAWLFLEERNPDRSPQAIIAQIKNLKPDSIHLISSGTSSKAFAEALSRSGLKIPVTTSSLAFDGATPKPVTIKTATTFTEESAVQALANRISKRINTALGETPELMQVLHALREQQRKSTPLEIRLQSASQQLERLKIHDHAAQMRPEGLRSGINQPYCV